LGLATATNNTADVEGRAGSNISSNSRSAEVTNEDLTTWKSDVLTRIACLERELEVARSQSSKETPRLDNGRTCTVAQPGSASPGAFQDSTPLATDDEDSEASHARPRFQSGTDLVTPISILERTVGGGSSVEEASSTGRERRASQSNCRHVKPARFSGCCGRALQLWKRNTKDQDIETLRAYIDTYFACMNKHRKPFSP
jgi:hypothetical protein